MNFSNILDCFGYTCEILTVDFNKSIMVSISDSLIQKIFCFCHFQIRLKAILVFFKRSFQWYLRSEGQVFQLFVSFQYSFWSRKSYQTLTILGLEWEFWLVLAELQVFSPSFHQVSLDLFQFSNYIFGQILTYLSYTWV